MSCIIFNAVISMPSFSECLRRVSVYPAMVTVTTVIKYQTDTTWPTRSRPKGNREFGASNGHPDSKIDGGTDDWK